VAREPRVNETAKIKTEQPKSEVLGLGRQAISGVMVLGLRQVIVQGCNIVGSVILARILTTEQFGVYAIITFAVGFLTTFGDAGLAASLVRQAHEPEEIDYQAVFTVQQIFIVVLTILVWFMAPSISIAYRLPLEGAWLFRLLSVALLVTSFQTISVVRLERKLQFHRLAIAEGAQAITFNTVAVLLALNGFGVLSFGIAVLSRAIVSAFIIYFSSPWKMIWRWDIARIRTHLNFGIPYQGISLISVLKDSISPIFIGLLINTAAVGQVNWAQTLAAYPPMGLMLFQRLYLPVFSKLQTQPGKLGIFLSEVIILTNAIVAPLSMLTVFFAQPITQVFFGEKWLSSLPLFYLFWLSSLIIPTITPIFGAINAMGKSRIAFNFALMWMLVTWIVGLPFIFFFGILGYAISSLFVQLTNFYVYRYACFIENFKFSSKIFLIWGVSFLVNALMFLFSMALQVQNHGYTSLLMQLLLSLTLYFILSIKFKLFHLNALKEFK
jgi:O-antigen/teichoic acid export membrane protein